MKELILGGARSGKSRLAERRAAESALAVTYVATAEARDAEMAARIAAHRRRRPPGWRTVEAPRELAPTLLAEAADERCLLVDCLTLWLANALEAEAAEQESEALLAALPSLPGRLILVSNEVGLGVVPANVAARRYADLAGHLHQRLADACERVTLVVAGHPLAVKGAVA